jgi:DNA excision repair protein ERCC-4
VPLSTTSHIYIRSFNQSATDHSDMLDSIKPHYIILYAPSITMIRKIEIHKSLYPTQKIKVYFLIYDNSVEEQHYLTSLNREKQSFEKLIAQKTTVSIPLDTRNMHYEALFNTREGGGQSTIVEKKVSVVNRF